MGVGPDSTSFFRLGGLVMENPQMSGTQDTGEAGYSRRVSACTPAGATILGMFAPVLVWPFFIAYASTWDPSGNALTTACLLQLLIVVALAGVALGCVRRCWRRRGQLSPWFGGFALFACAVDVLAVTGVCAWIFLNAGAGA